LKVILLAPSAVEGDVLVASVPPVRA